MAEESQGRGLYVLLIGAVAFVLLGGGAYLASRWMPSAATGSEPLRMGPAEQVYAQQIHFEDPHLSRTANFLNQEVTSVSGTTRNDGPMAVRQIEVTIEFHDPFNQVVLRDTQRLFGVNAASLGPHQSRDFQVNYDGLPATWNEAYPTIRITGLDLR